CRYPETRSQRQQASSFEAHCERRTSNRGLRHRAKPSPRYLGILHALATCCRVPCGSPQQHLWQTFLSVPTLPASMHDGIRFLQTVLIQCGEIEASNEAGARTSSSNRLEHFLDGNDHSIEFASFG